MPNSALHYCVYAIRPTCQVLHYRGLGWRHRQMRLWLVCEENLSIEPTHLPHLAPELEWPTRNYGITGKWHGIADRHVNPAQLGIGQSHTDKHTGPTTVTSLPRVDGDGEACREA